MTFPVFFRTGGASRSSVLAAQACIRDEAGFQKVCEDLSDILMCRDNRMARLRDRAMEIQALYRQLSGPLDDLCRATCPYCPDNCCGRATIWYDFRDLLYLSLGPGRLPRAQIRRVDKDGVRQCSCLGDRGCTLPRDRRPFICTWYFCPDQKAAMADPCWPFGRAMAPDRVEQIKRKRKELETAFFGLCKKLKKV